MAGLVVDPARRVLDGVEDYVLVEAGGHPVRKLEPGRIPGIELRARVVVLPANDLVEPLDLHESDGGGELAHPVVEAFHLEVRLAVVAVEAGAGGEPGVPPGPHAPPPPGGRPGGGGGEKPRAPPPPPPPA